MTETRLETRYRRSIGCLNDRRIEEPGASVHDELTCDGRPMTRRDDQGPATS